ncbi:hypothetical protein B9W62_33615 [Streptomyces sp. CS113]|uniref:hypothetical protein n=1 Tax=Streptomyces sp. CS113 TaxID=1982761 RepID=UPI000B712393|nr:hypothetical protein B9W62_33615 [Streptomyces sp. CS113]
MLGEDRQEYERILDAALRSAPHRPELATVGQRLNSEQLRTMALNATPLITAVAATEYQHYVQVRELNRPARPVPAPFHGPDAKYPGAVRIPLGAHQNSAGPAAVVAVLAPVLAATVAVLALLVGFILRTLAPGSAFARTLLTVGWVSGAVAAATFLVAAVGLLLTALRNGRSPETGLHDESSREVEQAREAWREALLERGILPFLREALTDPGTAAAPQHPAPPVANSRVPSLGHQRPGFTSPDFTSPDFGGPAESGPATGPEESG